MMAFSEDPPTLELACVAMSPICPDTVTGVVPYLLKPQEEARK